MNISPVHMQHVKHITCLTLGDSVLWCTSGRCPLLLHSHWLLTDTVEASYGLQRWQTDKHTDTWICKHGKRKPVQQLLIYSITLKYQHCFKGGREFSFLSTSTHKVCDSVQEQATTTSRSSATVWHMKSWTILWVCRSTQTVLQPSSPLWLKSCTCMWSWLTSYSEPITSHPKLEGTVQRDYSGFHPSQV